MILTKTLEDAISCGVYSNDDHYFVNKNKVDEAEISCAGEYLIVAIS